MKQAEFPCISRVICKYQLIDLPRRSKVQIEIGSEVFIGDVSGRGGHGAYITVTKVNRRSIKGVERQGSYKPGTNWTIAATVEIALVGKTGDGRVCQRWGELSDNGVII